MPVIRPLLCILCCLAASALLVYLPPDLQLKYRVWRADKTLSEAGR